jgi:hypothetical protein
VANGWLQRAHRLLDGMELGPDHGWLAAHEASIVLDEDAAPPGAWRRRLSSWVASSAFPNSRWWGWGSKGLPS